MIHLYLKISENFIYLSRMDSGLFCEFVGFVCDEINSFISFSQNIHLLFCCILSVFALILLVLLTIIVLLQKEIQFLS